MNKKIIGIVLIIITSFVFLSGFKNISSTPQELYRVYLKGESLGLIKSKEDFENYIDKKQESIKKKYKVEKVYTPEDLDIVKEITYDNDIKSNNEKYNEIKDISPFTINGYIIKIKGLESKQNEGGT